MLLDIEAFRQLRPRFLEDVLAHALRLLARGPVEIHRAQNVLPAGQLVGGLRRQLALEPGGNGVASRDGADVARRALDHHHMPGFLGDRRHQRHRGRAAADHRDPLARQRLALRPELRMQDLAAIALPARQVRRERVIVIVITRPDEQEPATIDPGAIGCLDAETPARLVAVPCGSRHLVLQQDPVAKTVLNRRFLNVVADGAALGDAEIARPRPEAIAEGEHVAVRAHAGVAEQVPCPADPLAPFEDHEALAGAALAEVMPGADAGDPGANDQMVDIDHRRVAAGLLAGLVTHRFVLVLVHAV